MMPRWAKNKRLIVATGAVLVTLLLAGSVVVAQNQMQTEGGDRAAPQQPLPDAQVLKNSDQRLAEAGALVSGFGGIRSDRNDNDIIYVFMLDPSQQEEAAKAAQSFLGAERWSRTKEVRVLQGQYTVPQLRDWYAVMHSRIREIFSDLPYHGIKWSGVSEGRNRIFVAVSNGEAKALVEAELGRLGIPLEAVIVEVNDTPIEFWSHKELDSDVDPVVGGLQVESPGAGTCSLGFVTDRDGVRGVVTNSHCALRFGADDGSVAVQPSLRNGGTRIGEETIDLVFFSGGTCPAGRLCRQSDSAFVDLDGGISSSLGHIARTTGLGTTTIDHVNPTFRIVEEGGPLMNDTVEKIGWVTGWTQGTIVDTCADIHNPWADLTIRCDYVAEELDIGSGDSGSPVFKIVDSPATGDVQLLGILWGGGRSQITGKAIRFVSFIGDIYLDLGLTSVWDTCDPAFAC